MKCWQCGTDNPEKNKFCAECGRPQISQRPSAGEPAQSTNSSEISQSPAGAAPPPVAPPPGVPLGIGQHNPLVEEPRVLHERVTPEAITEGVKAPREEQVRSAPPPASRQIHGPSFLGLSDDDASESSYLLEDEEPQRSHGRTLVLLVLLAVLGYLGYRYRGFLHDEGAKFAARSQTITEQAKSSKPVDSEPQLQQETGTISDDNKDRPQTSETPESGDTTAASNQEPGAERLTKPESDQSDAKSADPESNEQENAATHAAARKQAPEPAKIDNSKVEEAQRYLQGRGVAQDCNRGFILLRQAAEEENAKARIQMGALFATGQCVQQDRAQAYQWFRNAQALDPHNVRLQEMLDRMWTEMTPAERTRAEKE